MFPQEQRTSAVKAAEDETNTYPHCQSHPHQDGVRPRAQERGDVGKPSLPTCLPPFGWTRSEKDDNAQMVAETSEMYRTG